MAEERKVQVRLSDSLFQAGPLTLLRGYKRATDRYLAAAQQDTDFAETFIPLFEALNWAVSLRDRLGKEGRPIRDRLALALGYARDRVHHDWAGALHPRRLQVSASEPAAPVLSGLSVEWFWKRVDELPTPTGGTKKEQKAYEDVLAGQSAYATLMQLLALFERNALPASAAT
jgi:hypothetical protein